MWRLLLKYTEFLMTDTGFQLVVSDKVLVESQTTKGSQTEQLHATIRIPFFLIALHLSTAICLMAQC